jgi:hypothetical protein
MDKRGPGFDCWCKDCRIADSLKYQAAHGCSSGKSKYVRKKAMYLNREKEENFTKYMKENPYYFRSVFHMEAHENNIKRAFQGVA